MVHPMIEAGGLAIYRLMYGASAYPSPMEEHTYQQKFIAAARVILSAEPTDGQLKAGAITVMDDLKPADRHTVTCLDCASYLALQTIKAANAALLAELEG